MPEIIPAIIAKSFRELQEKVKLVEPYVCPEPGRGIKTVQLDVMDGVFVSNKTWPFVVPPSGTPQGKSYFVDTTNGKPSPRDLEKLETNLELEAHLMVDSPHSVLNEWLASPVDRIIVHWEAINKIFNFQFSIFNKFSNKPIFNLIKKTHNVNKEFGVALNLETPISVLDNFINEIDMALLMSVQPGRGGQEFQESVIPKIISLRQKYPSVKIGVDGGVNSQNILKLVEAGADFLVMGSAIFGSDDIGGTIERLQNVIAA